MNPTNKEIHSCNFQEQLGKSIYYRAIIIYWKRSFVWCLFSYLHNLISQYIFGKGHNFFDPNQERVIFVVVVVVVVFAFLGRSSFIATGCNANLLDHHPLQTIMIAP